jgi:Pyruvate/2-oxoacid:ferredoxin oxidoreductase delta subunit
MEQRPGEEKSITIRPEYREELCDGCNHCVIACPCGGIVLVNQKIKLVETESCGYCGVCEAVCPRFAIRCEYTIVLEEEA